MIDVDAKGRYTLTYKGNLTSEGLTFNRGAFNTERKVLGECEVEIKITPWFKKRSNQQNRLLWLWCTIIATHTGASPDVVKGIAQKMFLTVEETIEATGEVFTRVKGTSELDTLEMKKFLDELHAWATEYFGVDLPLPDQQMKML
jgi:hypothetical protein